MFCDTRCSSPMLKIIAYVNHTAYERSEKDSDEFTKAMLNSHANMYDLMRNLCDYGLNLERFVPVLCILMCLASDTFTPSNHQ